MGRRQRCRQRAAVWTEARGSSHDNEHVDGGICGEELRTARALPAQDGQLVSQGDESELQGEATANPKREQRTEGGQKRKHADDGMTAAPETLCFLGFLEF